jgi:cleavage and polyadenylation specificity factor subunit 1
MRDITAATVAVTFMEMWVSRFGVPLYVVTDRGSQFESELFKELSTLVGFCRLRTTAFHAQANGMIERQHRVLKNSIVARKQNWLRALPIVLLGMRALPNESGFSPSAAVTGTSILFPRPMLNEHDQSFTSQSVQKLAEEMSKINFDELSQGRLHSTTKEYVPKEMKKCSHVWVRVDRVRRPLEAPYQGPFRVVARHPKYFTIEDNAGNFKTIAIDRLKPAHIAEDNKICPNKPVIQTNTTKIDTASKNEETNCKTSVCSDGARVNDKDYKTTCSGRKITFRANDDFIYY